MKLIFEFSGGSRDGQTDVGDTDFNLIDYGRNRAGGNHWITENATIGKRFWQPTEYLDQQTMLHDKTADGGLEAYEIIERREEGDTVYVKCQFYKHSNS